MIGTGGIAQGAHMPAYAALPNVDIVAVCDANEKAVADAAKKFNVPHVFSDYREMLKLDGLDAVDICTPNDMHAEPAIAAVAAGKHVLVEKPIARNAAEASTMVEAARKAGRKLMVAHNWRFSTGGAALKRFIDAGDLGEMYFSKVIAIRRRGIPSWGVFTQKDKQGGGPLIDIGVHMIDLALWLLGHPKPVAASSQCYAKFGTREGIFNMWGQWDTKNFTVEDFATALIRFESGSTMYVESSFMANIDHDICNVQILGTDGGCELAPLKLYREEHQMVVDVTPVMLPNINSYEAEVRAFVNSIIGDAEPPIPGEQALMTAKIIDAIYESSEKGKEVAIS